MTLLQHLQQAENSLVSLDSAATKALQELDKFLDQEQRSEHLSTYNALRDLKSRLTRYFEVTRIPPH